MAARVSNQQVSFEAAPSTSRSALLGGCSTSAAFVTALHHYEQRNPSLDYLMTTLERCHMAMERVSFMEQCLVESGFVTDNRSNGRALIELECKMLDLAAIPDLCSDIFYLLLYKISENQYVARYFEAGSAKGFFCAKGRDLLIDHVGRSSQILPYSIFSREDISLRQSHLHQRRKGKPYDLRQLNQAFNRMTRIEKSSVGMLVDSVLNYIEQPDEDTRERVKAFLVYARKSRSARNNFNDSPFYQWGLDSLAPAIHETLLSYSCDENVTKSWAIDLHKLNYYLQPENIEQQLQIISELPNAYWPCGFQRLENVTFMQRLSWKSKESTYKPCSIRNRIIYHCLLAQGPGSFRKHLATICRQFLGCATENRVELTEENRHEPFDAGGVVEGRASQTAKRCRTTSKVRIVSEETIRGQLRRGTESGMDNCFNISPYQHFVKTMVEHGQFIWRFSSDNNDIILLNDVSETTGEFSFVSFCHVTVRHDNDDESDELVCSCSIYKLLQRLSLSDRAGEMVGDVILDCKSTCMHCRLVNEHFLPFKRDPNRFPRTGLQKKLSDSLACRNDGVVCIGPAQAYDTIKFSVVNAEGNCEFVHLGRGGVQVICQSGICNVQMMQSRSSGARRLITLDESDSRRLCSHLQTMKACQEIWIHYLPGCDASPEGDLDKDGSGENETFDINEPESNVSVETILSEAMDTNENSPLQFTHHIGFCMDDEGGSWDFGGVSIHKPTPSKSDKLNRNVQKRQMITDETCKRDIFGYFVGGLLAVAYNPHCSCGAGFEDVNIIDAVNLCRQYRKDTTLYMKQGPVKYTVCERHCRNSDMPCVVPYTGEADSIHFWTEETALADEVGHTYLSLLFGAGQSFSAFCDYMTEEYRNFNNRSAKFMSNTTFTSCMFSWLGRMNIDFREHIDPYCGYHPKILACDATHAGISFRHMKVKAIECAELAEERVISHRRYTRVFLSDSLVQDSRGLDVAHVRTARSHLKYLSRQMLKELSPSERLSEDEVHQRNELLLQIVPPECHALLKNFTSRIYECAMLEAAARIFYLLASDAPMTAFIPYSQCHTILSAVNGFVEGTNIDDNLLCISNIFPELKMLLNAASHTGHLLDVKSFVTYLCNAIEQCHSGDASVFENYIPQSYNPASGIAYYFTRHGNQVRKLPQYGADKATRSSTYDDSPSVDEKCSKRFPTVGQMGGYSNLFLWFCPEHGHSYGFHLIPGSEGRKDPFASIFKYLPSPPTHIFYDFACQLSEYCLNREPSYFRDVRFCHDIFHGYSHLCGGAFKANRHKSLFVNTSICEQFNSYLKKVKYVASHLSQNRYVFLLQYALYVWNERKTLAYEERVRVALASIQQ